MGDDSRPVIQVDPAVRFGAPQIAGISTDAIAGMVMGGESTEVVAAEYGLTRHQVLLACWWEGSGGCYRRQWSGWAEQVHPTLAGWTKLAGRDTPASVDELPDPPSQADLNVAAR